MTPETIRRTARLPLLVGAAMLCASAALAEGEGTTIQGPDAAAGVGSPDGSSTGAVSDGGIGASISACSLSAALSDSKIARPRSATGSC